MPKTNTLVKICGLTSEEQALQIAKLGANAIGIISVEESPRYISAEIKKNIFTTLERLYPKIERVSVVQNCPIDLIIKNFLGNPSETIIQLHGDEDIDYCKKIRKKIPNIGLWKAFRIKTNKDIDKIKPFEDFIDAILLDSWNKETYGGSGKKINSIYLKNLLLILCLYFFHIQCQSIIRAGAKLFHDFRIYSHKMLNLFFQFLLYQFD